MRSVVRGWRGERQPCLPGSRASLECWAPLHILRPPTPLVSPPTVSTSFHALQDLGVCRGELDYVLLSPIYASISKPGYGGSGAAAAFPDADGLASALAGSRYPVLALGGVTPERFPELAELGFAGAALLGSIWSADDPLAAWEAAKRAADQLP